MKSRVSLILLALLCFCIATAVAQKKAMVLRTSEAPPDTTAPVIESVAVNEGVWTVHYSENVTGQVGFTAVGSTTGAITLTGATGNGTDTHTFTGSALAVYNETLTYDYTPGNARDSAGNSLAAVDDGAVTNNSPTPGDVVAPTLQTRTIGLNGTTWTLVFSEATFGTGGFSAVGSTTGAIALTYVSGNGTTTHIYSGSPAAASGETVTLDYTPGSLVDGNGNALAAIDDAVVTNNTAGEGTAPILTQPQAIFRQNASSVDFTPEVLQGENLEFSIDAMPGWTEEAFDTETGQLAGTVSTGVYTVMITATNTVTEEYYDIWLRVHVGSSQETIDETWLANNGTTAADGTTYYVLSTANRTYNIDDDISVDGDLFYLTANGIGINGNGHTLTYNNATPITIANNSFETVDPGDADLADDWDFTNAANATRYAGVFLDNEVFKGDYSLRFDCPSADNEYVESEGTLSLQPNTTYCLSVMMHYGKKGLSASDAPLIPDGLEMYAQLVGQGGEDTQEIRFLDTTFGAGRFTRGIQLLTTTFTTPAGSPSYKVRLGVSGGANSAGDDVYFDLVKVTRYQDFALGSSYHRNDWTLSDCTVTQGQDAGYDCDAIRPTSSNNACLDAVAVAVNGDDCNCVMNPDGTPDRFDIQGSTFAQTSDAGSSRDNNTAAVILTVTGNFVHNNITEGIHTGLVPWGAWAGTPDLWDRCVAYNTISLKAFYTNGFAIFPGDTEDLATKIYKNTINSGSGDYQSRGIAPGVEPRMFDNVINVQALANSQEYGGIQTGGAYAVQHEGGYATATITNQTQIVTGDSGGACIRVTGVASGTITYRDCVLTVDANSNVGLGTRDANPAVIKTHSADFDKLILDSCEITTNCNLVTVSQSETGQLLFKNCSITYVDDGLTGDHCLGNNYQGNINCRFLDCTLSGTGVDTWFDANVGTELGTDTTNVRQEVANTVIITFTDGGNPVANTAVTVDDEQSTEVYNGTTDANGQITFVAEDWHRVNGTKTNYQTHTFNVSGYAPETEDLTNTNNAPTVELTAE